MTQRASAEREAGTSPVIATVLLVGVTLTLGVAVYAFSGGFGVEAPGEQAAVSITGYDANEDGKVDWIRVLLVRGENAPYRPEDVSLTLLDEEGHALSELAGLEEDEADTLLCLRADPVAGEHDADVRCKKKTGTGNNGQGQGKGEHTAWFQKGEPWDAGQVLYLPCQDASDDGSGPHLLTLVFRDTVVADRTIECQQQPKLS